VNVAAALSSTGLTVTPAVFRSLQVESRTLFKNHTPPIVVRSRRSAQRATGELLGIRQLEDDERTGRRSRHP
jgi:hypothetical protein